MAERERERRSGETEEDIAKADARHKRLVDAQESRRKAEDRSRSGRESGYKDWPLMNTGGDGQSGERSRRALPKAGHAIAGLEPIAGLHRPGAPKPLEVDGPIVPFDGSGGIEI